MGRQTEKPTKPHTLPSSPSRSFSSSSSSSSDFEFTISLSPRKSTAALCPADELFYKGQLLPLHLSPRISMVRTLLLSSSSTSSSATNSASARDSTGSSNDSHSSFNSDLLLFADCDSSRPSSVTEDEEFKRLHNPYIATTTHHQVKKPNKYFSLSRFSSVFKKDPNKIRDRDNLTGSSPVRRMSATAKEVIRKYLKKVKPFYEKLSQQTQQRMGNGASFLKTERSTNTREIETEHIKEKGTTTTTTRGVSHSFSGNLRCPRRRRCVSSCPSSMRSSPSHSGVLSRNGFTGPGRTGSGNYLSSSDMSSMEELQSAIQGAIAHCKNSMMFQTKIMVSDEF